MRVEHRFCCLSWAMSDCAAVSLRAANVGSPRAVRATQGAEVPQGGCQGLGVARSECA